MTRTTWLAAADAVGWATTFVAVGIGDRSPDLIFGTLRALCPTVNEQLIRATSRQDTSR